MRILVPLFAALTALPALDGVTITPWNGMLIVSAPSAVDIGAFGGRLEQRITLDAREQPLPDIAAFLRSVTGLNVVVAPALLAKPPLVTLRVKDMRLGNLLRWIERVAAIHAGVEHGALLLSDQPIAGATETRIYGVRDLGTRPPDFPGPELALPQPSGGAALPPAASAGTSGYDHDELQRLIEWFVLNR